LNLKLEQVYPIQGLAFPDCEIPKDAAEYSAINLFIQTAQSMQPDFVVTASDWIHLTRICQLVEGMPLGLELAAAWVDVLSLADIAVEIQQSLDFLETELRDLPSRHRSMRATIKYSWRKLNEKEQSIFSQLSVFRGGFTRDAAQAVTGATLRQLSRLVNKSFIRFNQQLDRYQVHELIRQYGTERLRQDSELESSLRHRHSSYYCQMLAEYTDDLKGTGQLQAEAAIESDINNIRMAWNQAIINGEIEAIDISYEPLYLYYVRNGRHMQGIREFEGALAMLRTNQTTEKRRIILGRTLYFLGYLYTFPDQHEKAVECLKESIEIFQRLGAREETLRPLLTLARLQTSMEKSNKLYCECLTLAREVGDPWAIGLALQQMGENDRDSGNYQQAKRRIQEALKHRRKTDNIGNVIWPIAWLSILAVDLGNYNEALTLARECASIERKIALKYPMVSTRVLGKALYAIGEYEKAEDQFQQSLAFSREQNLGAWTPLCLFHLGEISFSTGNYTRSNQRYKQSLAEALEFNNFELVARNQNALGRLALAQGDYLQAGEHLLEALRTANLLGRPPILLAIFATAAELFAVEGSLDNAVLLATFVMDHPASQAKVKERVKKVLSDLEGQLTAEELAMIHQRSQESDLDSLAAQLVVDLEKA
jgi:predicted ATPase